MFSDDWRLSTFPCISSGAWQLFRLSVSCTLRLKTTVDYSSSGWVLLHRGQNEMQRLWSRKAFSFSNFVVAPLFSLCLFWNGMGKCIDDSLSLSSVKTSKIYTSNISLKRERNRSEDEVRLQKHPMFWSTEGGAVRVSTPSLFLTLFFFLCILCYRIEDES